MVKLHINGLKIETEREKYYENYFNTNRVEFFNASWKTIITAILLNADILNVMDDPLLKIYAKKLIEIAKEYDDLLDKPKLCWQCNKKLNLEDIKNIPDPICFECEYKRNM